MSEPSSQPAPPPSSAAPPAPPPALPAVPALPPAIGAVARRLMRYARHHRAGYAASIVCFVGASLMEPLLPALLGYTLNEGFTQSPSFPLWTVPVALVAIFVLRGIFSFLAQYLITWANSRTVMDLRLDLLRALLRADAQLYHDVTPGVAVTRVINDPQNATQQLGSAATAVLRDGTHTAVMLGYLLYLNATLALMLVVCLPVLAWVVRRVHRRALAIGGVMYDSQLRLVGVVDDVARAWRVVRTFDAGDFELGRFAAEARRHQKLTVKNAAAAATMSPVSQLIASFGIAAVLGVALLQASHGTTRVGDFVAFITAALLLVSRIKSLTDLSQPVVGGLIGARACFDLIDTPAEPDTGTVELAACSGRLQLRDVCVRYPGADRDALSGFSLELHPGQTVALVGASGAGKSSVVNLLLGFVAASSGSATLDGVPLEAIRKASLRRQFAVVSQDIVLFDGSLADNVVYAKPHDDARVEQCLRAAQLWHWVSQLPQREDTLVGANGSRLSGGQRQRLAIARALYKDAPLCILDEATSSLDTESERAVQSAIENWAGSKTLIVIAHRLSTVRNADHIVVLADGRVAEAGPPAELLRRDGLYARMVRAQSAEAPAEEVLV